MKSHAGKIRRFYQPALIAGEVALTPEESHHAANVLRLRVGDIIELFDGKGKTAAGELTEVHRKHTMVRIESVHEHLPTSPAITLAFAVPKNKRLDWLLEKATELGAAKLIPVVFQRSVAGGEKITSSKHDRWFGHCVSAAKQSGLNFLPELCDILSLDDFLADCEDSTKIVGDCCDGCQALRDISAGDEGSITLLVGPEGGFTEDERKKIADAGFKAARLGDTVLRIETAGVALISAVRALTYRQL